MLIVPDIHGRDFWKEPVFEHFSTLTSTDEIDRKVVFLGDYLDPYGYENISVVAAIERFKQVINLKKEHPDDIVLLLGNHDWSYIMPERFSASRHDSFFEEEAHTLFMDNIDLFQMFYLCDMNGKHYVFSHAGIHPEWMSMYLGVESYEAVANLYNRRPEDIPSHCLDLLNCISANRGGAAAVGSPIWCDVDEFENATLPTNYYQIFGHTQQLKSPIITERFACLDCRQVFRLNIQNKEIFEIFEKVSILVV